MYMLNIVHVELTKKKNTYLSKALWFSSIQILPEII